MSYGLNKTNYGCFLSTKVGIHALFVHMDADVNGRFRVCRYGY
jgi:hypothetical protein